MESGFTLIDKTNTDGDFQEFQSCGGLRYSATPKLVKLAEIQGIEFDLSIDRVIPSEQCSEYADKCNQLTNISDDQLTELGFEFADSFNIGTFLLDLEQLFRNAARTNLNVWCH